MPYSLQRHSFRSSALGEVVPAGQAIDGLLPAPEGDVSRRDLSYHRERYIDAFCQRVEDPLGRGDQKLVVLASGGREDRGVVAQGADESSGIFHDGQEV